MKMVLSVFSVVTLLVFSACSAEKFGSGIDGSAPKIKVKDVYLDPASAGKRVTVEGKISSQCGSNGCWFVLDDTTGQMFINLAPANITIPPRMGKKARVSGTVTRVQDELQLFAHGVELR